MLPCDASPPTDVRLPGIHPGDQTPTDAASRRCRDSSPASPSTPPSSSSSTTPHPTEEPSRPPTPRPWLWRCHACHAALRLSCGRRCLRCGHFMCARRLLPGESRGDVCGTEFDYRRWAAWGDWRRERKRKRGRDGDEEEPGGKEEEEEEQQRKRGMCEGRGASASTCWGDCDYPSECHHTRAETWTEDGDDEEGDEFDVSSPWMGAARDVLSMSADEADFMFEAAVYLEGDRFSGDEDLDVYPPMIEIEDDVCGGYGTSPSHGVGALYDCGEPQP